jgi:outer membrane lipoprotein-sorting protein
MCSPSNNLPDDLLEKAIASLRDSAGTSGPTPEVIEQTLARIEAAQAFHASPRINWRILMKPRFSLAAAAIIAVALLGLFWTQFLGSGNIALGEVIAKVNAVRSVSFKSTSTVRVPNMPAQTVISDVTIAEPTRMRQVVHPMGMITVADFNAGKWLTLQPQSKTASVVAISGMPKEAQQANILEQFRNLDPKVYQKIGERVVENRPAVGFTTTEAPTGSKKTIWVDKETQLPVQVEMESNGGILGTQTTVFSDFQWDVPINEADFSVTPPQGYTVQHGRMDMSNVTESDVTDALRTLAELNDDTFPDRFDVAGLARLLALRTVKLGRENKEQELKKFQDEMMQKSVKVGRAWMFISTPANGTDFHYAGKGVKLDQPDTPILWYKPVGSDSYRVIDADLTIRAVGAGEVPKAESILLNAPAATQPANH